MSHPLHVVKEIENMCEEGLKVMALLSHTNESIVSFFECGFLKVVMEKAKADPSRRSTAKGLKATDKS